MADESARSLAEAVLRFLAELPAEQKQGYQQELNRFVVWYGGQRPISELQPKEVADYADSLSLSAEATARRLEPLRDFLTYAKKAKLTKSNLGVHLRVSRSTSKKRKKSQRGSAQAAAVTLTAEGYASLEARLAALKRERPQLAEEIRRAAADKDVRENAPLEAARERHGQVEGQIRELEAALKEARIIQGQTSAGLRIGLGSKVVLRDLADNEDVSYTLVHPNEADPAAGKVSIASPTGQALLEHSEGEVIEVTAPAGTLRYRIESVGH